MLCDSAAISLPPNCHADLSDPRVPFRYEDHRPARDCISFCPFNFMAQLPRYLRPGLVLFRTLQIVHLVMTFTALELSQHAAKRYDFTRHSHLVVPGSPYFQERVEKCQNDVCDAVDFLYAKLAEITGRDVQDVRREMESEEDLCEEMESPPKPKNRRRQRRRPRKSSTAEKSSAEIACKASDNIGNHPRNNPKTRDEPSGKTSNAPGEIPRKTPGGKGLSNSSRQASGKPFAPMHGQEQRTQGNRHVATINSVGKGKTLNCLPILVS